MYPLLYGVGLTYGSLCSRNAAGDATVALAHAPQLTADFLCVCERTVKTEREEQNKICQSIATHCCSPSFLLYCVCMFWPHNTDINESIKHYAATDVGLNVAP